MSGKSTSNSATPRTATDNVTQLKRNGVILLQGYSVRPLPVDWLWDQYLAVGKLHLLASEPGAGKTSIAISLGATISVAGRWPDGTPCQEARDVVIWSSEDDFQDTILPRFIAGGGDRKRLHFVAGVQDGDKKRSFDPKKDLSLLIDAIKAIGNVGLLIIDSIADILKGDSNNNTKARDSLTPLTEIAIQEKFAIIGIAHFNKDAGDSKYRNPLQRINGSVGIGAVARIAFACAVGTDGERRFVRIKSNIGENDGGFAYQIQPDELPGYPGIIATSTVWKERLEGRARDLLAIGDADSSDRSEPPAPSRKEDAVAFLVRILSDVDMLRQTEVERLAAEHDPPFAMRTLKRAKADAGVRSICSTGTTKIWYWKIVPPTLP